MQKDTLMEILGKFMFIEVKEKKDPVTDYSACNPIQISVYEDKIYIWNDGEMPSGLNSTEKLFEKHSSQAV